MKTLTVGHLKTDFSQVLEHIRHGEEYGIAYGKKKHTIAVIVPIQKYANLHKRTLGILEKAGKKIILKKDFKITDDELLLA